jgi:CheY-like chemotaxis protein
MPKNVLVADDSITIRKVIGMIFSTEDFQVHTVDNGIDAIHKTRELRPDIVLADVMMPGKSGYDVCGTLKADPATQDIPVVLLAGTFEAFDENRARAARADDHITKPFESQVLLDKVKALLGVRADAPVAPRAFTLAQPQPPAPAVPVPGAAPSGIPRPTRPGGLPAAGPAIPGIPRGPTTTPQPMPAMRPGVPGVPMPAGARPGPGMPGLPPPGAHPGLPRPGGPGMPGARPVPGMPGIPGAGGTRPGIPAPPGAPRPLAGMTPGAATPAGGLPRAPGAPGVPLPPGARPMPGIPPGAGIPRPAGPPGPVPQRQDPFGLGAPAQPAARPRPPEPSVVVDDQMPEPRGAEEISLDVGPRPAAAPAPARQQARAADGGEAVLREALSKASREVVEKIAWEVVPQLAETIIREELERLIKDREGKS